MQYFVEIVQYENQKFVKRIECDTEREANKVDSGANINLNHERFFTRIVKEDEQEKVE